MNVPGVVVVCKQSGIRMSFQCKHVRIRILQTEIDESENTHPKKSPLV